MPLIIAGNRQASTGYTVDQSIRFNDDDSAYMYRTPSANGSETKWTFSAWVKRGNISSDMDLFGHSNSDSAGDRVYITLLADNTLLMNGVGSSLTMSVITNQLFRDVSAWYHITIAFDSTLSIESERVRFYLNGSRITSLKAHDSATPDYPSLNEGFGTNQTTRTHVIGRYNYGSGSRYFDGYMAEIHWLDGYGYGAEFFGEFNDSGIWIPKEYTGSYGTNGFKIDGRDASDLGDDESGNGNDYTTSGLASNDQRSDSPTNNFATFNPLVASSDTFIYSDGNLKSLSNTNSAAFTGLTQAIKTGKYVIEFDVGSSLQSSSSVGVGMCTLDYFTSNQASTTQDNLGSQSDSFLFRDNTGNDSTRMFIESSSAITTNNPTLGSNDRFFIYVDADNGKAWVGLYDSSASSTSIYGSDFDTVGNPATGANPTLSFTSGTEMMIFVQYYNGNGLTIETEPSKMTHSVVSGYNAINTKNLGS